MYTFLNSVKNLTRSFIQNLGRNRFTAFFVGGIILGGFFVSLLLSSLAPAITEDVDLYPFVTIKTVSDLSSGGNTLSLIGEIKSISEAIIYTETAGIIQYVSYELGDWVASGAVIAEIENSREQASVSSARANLVQAEASFSRDISQVYINAENTYRNAFTLASDAVFGKTDTFFDAPRTSSPRLNISSFGESSLEEERAVINDMLAQWGKTLTGRVAESNISTLLESAQTDLNTIKLFFDRLATIVNRQSGGGSRSQATIDAEKTALFAARSNVDSALKNVATELNTLAQTLGVQSGGTGEADAKVDVARATLRSAISTLEKTIVRAPINGTINALDVKAGDFVGSFTPIATIANNDALEIVSFTSAQNADLLTAGAPVIIEGGHTGVITKVAPALNPTTKKLELRIGIQESTPSLINGSTVRISITTSPPANETAGVAVNKGAELLLIPLEALKLTTGSTVVFSVNSENKLESHAVTIGRIVGDAIVVDGLGRDLFIVTDARGLREGMRVEVRNEE